VSRNNREKSMRDLRNYLRANPQVFVLLVICLVLGIGTFLVVIVSLASSGGHLTGDPNEASVILLRAAGHLTGDPNEASVKLLRAAVAPLGVL
jgi:hypothetical protein